MMKQYAPLTAALLLLGLSTSAQSLKPGIHAHPERAQQRGGGAPANDECSGAIPLTVGTSCTPTNGNSANATQSMDPAEDCGDYVSPDAFDVWYSFVATSGMTNVEVTGISTYDAIMQVLTGDCSNPVPVACADQNYPLDPPEGDMTESLMVETTIGTTYYVRVYYYTNPLPADLDFTICVYATPPVTEYCIPSITEGCDEYISSVTLGGIASTSDCTESGYVDYTAQSTDLAVGTPTPISVLNSPTNYYAEDSVSVWGDWNHDFIFAPSERTMLASDDDGLTYAGVLTAPLSALNGPTRLRVRMIYNGVPSPCGETGYGETEDYTVNVTGGSSVGILDHAAPVEFSIYPNPSNGDITLTYADVSSIVNVELLDMTGRVVSAERRLLNKGERVTLSFAGKLSAGNYALRLTSEHGRSAQRLVVN